MSKSNGNRAVEENGTSSIKLIGGVKATAVSRNYFSSVAYRRYRDTAKVYLNGALIFTGDPEIAKRTYNKRLAAVWQRAYGRKPPAVLKV